MAKTEKRLIGDNVYEVTLLGFGQARKVMTRITKLLGPTVATLIESMGTGGAKDKIVASLLKDSRGVAGAIAEFSTRLTENDLEWLSTVFGDSSVVHLPENKSPHLTLKYQEDFWPGRYDEWFLWLGFCLEVNFASFFRNLKAHKSIESDTLLAPSETATA